MMDDARLDILFFSRDPGGTNVLVPMIKHFQRLYKIEVFAKDLAETIYQKEGVQYRNIVDVISNFDGESIRTFLSMKQPRLVITGTSTIDRSEYRFWMCCRELGIICCANVDSWAFYKERFCIEPLSLGVSIIETGKSFFPDYILAIDQEAKKEMEKDGIPTEKIVVAGYWHFFYQRGEIRKRDGRNVARFRRKLLNGKKARIILFLSEGFSDLFGEDPESGYGYHEKTTFSALEDALRPYENTEDYMLVVRPHPKEKLEWWFETMHKSSLEIIVDKDTELLDQIQAADLVTGMQTQCLNDALLAEKPVISIQIGLNRKNPLFASRHGLIRTALTNESLERYIADFFSGKLQSKNIELDSSDMDRFIDFIGEVIKNG